MVMFQEYMFTVLSNLVFVFLIPFFVGLITISLLKNFSEKTGKVMDIAEGDILKIHQKPISLLGGLGMIVSLLSGFLFVTGKNNIFEFALLVFGLLVIFLIQAL